MRLQLGSGYYRSSSCHVLADATMTLSIAIVISEGQFQFCYCCVPAGGRGMGRGLKGLISPRDWCDVTRVLPTVPGQAPRETFIVCAAIKAVFVFFGFLF